MAHVKEAAHLFQGVTDSTMIHAEGWHYIQIGRSIERAAATATMLEALFDDAEVAVGDGGIGAYVSWMALLRSCSGFEAYCQRYTADVRPEQVAEFLLLSARLSDDPCASPSTPSKRRSARSRERSGAMRKDASIAWPVVCARPSTTARSTRSWPTASRATCRGIRRQCEQVHTALYQTYISYRTESAVAS